MKLINIEKSTIQRYIDMNRTVIVCKFMPYKNNTCIKVYTFEDEPVGDIPESEVPNYLGKESEAFCFKQIFNEETGLFEIVAETLL